MSDYTKNILMRIRRVDVTDQKSPFFFIPADTYSYFSVGEAVQDASSLSDDSNVVIRFKVIIDSKYQTINRQVYSLGDMFGQIGGMDSIFLTIGSIFMKILVSKIYTASLISVFYRIKSKVNSESKIYPNNQKKELKDVSDSQLDDLKNDEESSNKLELTSKFNIFK